MPSIAVYLIFAAVVVRAAVVLSVRSEFPAVMALLMCYGILLFGKTWLVHRRPFPHLLPPTTQFTYLFLQSLLVIGTLIVSSYEDFIAMLFIPLSLDAVAVFGRSVGSLMITAFSLAMSITLLFSDVGWIFGLVMGLLYTGICFLVGGYAHQVQMSRFAHDHTEHMFQQLQAAHHELKKYADQKAELAIEAERNRLAHELHDSVTQTVFSMNLAVQSAHLLLDKEPSRAARQLIHIEELAASAQREIQILVSQLKPDSILGESLPNALHQLAAELNGQNVLEVSLEIHGEANFPEAVVACLYSIVHEALINVTKHSGACHALVRLDLNKGTSYLEIEDHGTGFDPDVVMDRSGHFGLVSMQERAHEIGWDLSVVSRPGQGTRIHVVESASGGFE
jgi:signal transduction histidine kinase